MYLRWKTRHTLYRRDFLMSARRGTTASLFWSAQLVTSERVDGKPRQRVVAHLGAINAEWLTNRHPDWDYWQREALRQRRAFWNAVNLRLTQLEVAGAITTEQRATFAAQIAERVAPPV